MSNFLHENDMTHYTHMTSLSKLSVTENDLPFVEFAESVCLCLNGVKFFPRTVSDAVI